MSRLAAFVAACASAAALITVATPAAQSAPASGSPTVVAGTTGARVGGSWCC